MKQNKIIILFQLTLKLVSWIHQVFKLSDIRPYREYQILVDSLLRINKTRGPVFLIKYIKSTRQALNIHLSGEFPVKRIPGVRVTSDGIPLILGPLIGPVRRGQSPATLQIVNTILYSTRALNLEAIPDTSSITSPPKGDLLVIKQYQRQFWKELGYRSNGHHTPRSLWFKQYHLTTKTGPNGHALWNSLADLDNVTPEMVYHLQTVGGPKLTEYINTLLKSKDCLSGKLPLKGKSHRKISYFPDKEDKVRIIAIGDYFTQAALKPLHHYLFKVLKKIPQDCTFNQAAFKDKINGWTRFYSIDLSNATDRFPIQTIIDTLEGHLPHEYLKSWKWLMVGMPFDFQGSKISYSVGNPMGFYSSWASFTVAHHYVMFYCCKVLRIPWKEAKYVLLGDDILIGDHQLAEKYKEVISGLGVEFSKVKTYESKNFFEFAKRLFINGSEISPFPVSSIKESHKRYYLMVNLLSELANKGWVAVEGIPSAIGRFYETVYPFRRSLRKVWIDKSLISEHIMKVMRGKETADMALNTIIRYFNYPIRELSPEESLGILSSLAVESFADSKFHDKDKTGYPLGKLAEDLVIHITGFEKPPIENLPDIIPMVPHLAVYGQIEEAYQNVMKEAYRIDTVGQGDWPLIMRTIALPLDDRVFVQRQAHLVSRASAIFGDHLRARLEFLASPMGRSMLGPKA
jgi:hypothetical protein